MLGALLSTKALSLVTMVSMIAVNPDNALKISFSHFAFNLTMAALALVVPPPALAMVEGSLPFKTTTVGVTFFLFFKAVPSFVLRGYDYLVVVVGPAY